MAAGTAHRGRADTPGAAPPRPPPFELTPWKLQPPPIRAGSVRRTAVLGLLLIEPRPPVVAVTGPPGYGKSTLVSQMSDEAAHAVATVSLDADDNDPSVLLAYLVAALDRIEPVDVETIRARLPPGSPAAATIARRVGAVLASMGTPVTLVLDQAEAVRNPQCRDAIAALAVHLPPDHRLVVVSRGEPPLPLALLRSGARIVEIGVDDLAMDHDEARQLVDGVGAPFDDEQLADVVRRTEGWPVGLYLAALAAQDATPGAAGDASRHDGGRAVDVPVPIPRDPFAGDDRLMADYLHAELLSRLPEATVTFLIRTSVLDRLSGRLCDAVTGIERSGALLESLARSNLLVVPLDRRGEWYRYHHLLADLLRFELEQRDPEAVAGLHGRAARWYADRGDTQAALGHAQAAGDVDEAARLVGEAAIQAYSSGRVDTCLGWLRWFDDRGETERRPQVAVLGAILHALVGNSAEVDRWTAAASTAAASDDPASDGSPIESWAALLNAFLCRSGVTAMQKDTEIALAGLASSSYWRPTALTLQGLALLFDGEPDRADAIFSRAADVGVGSGRLPAAAAALAERALLALARRDDDEAERLIGEAETLVDGGQLQDYPLTGIFDVAAARVALRRGDVGAARGYVAQASRLRLGLTAAIPFLAVQARLELARAYLELSDAAGARTLLREVRDVLQVRPDLGTLPAAAEALRAKVDAMGPGTVGESSLTTAELRLLPLLPTHLTFREMGERLHVSRHTIKTQAMSVYRKLGVSSRSEAIERVHAVGLLDD